MIDYMTYESSMSQGKHLTLYTQNIFLKSYVKTTSPISACTGVTNNAFYMCN